MSDKSENCPVCLKEMKEHTVLDMVNCSQKLINGLFELSQKDLEEYEKKDPDDLTIKAILQYNRHYQKTYSVV